jgi:hypothetical protein
MLLNYAQVKLCTYSITTDERNGKISVNGDNIFVHFTFYYVVSQTLILLLYKRLQNESGIGIIISGAENRGCVRLQIF